VYYFRWCAGRGPEQQLSPMPDPAKKGDRFGATSFASHWIDLVD
jgi:hypothetical protein